MAVNLAAPNPHDLHPVKGVALGVAMAGVRKANRKDLVAFVLDAGTQVAGVFTQNRFCAAPVQVCREHLAAEVFAVASARAKVHLERAVAGDPELRRLLDEVQSRELDPLTAVREILEKVFRIGTDAH